MPKGLSLGGGWEVGGPLAREPGIIIVRGLTLLLLLLLLLPIMPPPPPLCICCCCLGGGGGGPMAMAAAIAAPRAEFSASLSPELGRRYWLFMGRRGDSIPGSEGSGTPPPPEGLPAWMNWSESIGKMAQPGWPSSHQP